MRKRQRAQKEYAISRMYYWRRLINGEGWDRAHKASSKQVIVVVFFVFVPRFVIYVVLITVCKFEKDFFYTDCINRI